MNKSLIRKEKLKTIKTVLLTVIVCAMLASLGYFHTASTRKSYNQGVLDGMNVKDAQDIQNILAAH